MKTKERGWPAYQHEVLAILAGRQMQFRRVIKPQPQQSKNGRFTWGTPYKLGKPMPPRIPGGPRFCGGGKKVSITDLIGEYCPYGVPGDRLRVRETWQYEDAEYDPALGGGPIYPERIWYRADCIEEDAKQPWRPSIHMPRWASRLLLEVTDVRAERVQEISEEDAIAEGASARLLGNLIEPLANRCKVKPLHWINGAEDGVNYCNVCAGKRVRKLHKQEKPDAFVDGGGNFEETGPKFCDTCGVVLDCSYTDRAVKEELDHFEEYGIEGSTNAYSALNMLGWHGNPILTERCGDWAYMPELTGRVSRLAFRILWDSIYAKPKPTMDGKGNVSHYNSYPWEEITETRTHRSKPWYVYGNPYVFANTFKVVKQ